MVNTLYPKLPFKEVSQEEATRILTQEGAFAILAEGAGTYVVGRCLLEHLLVLIRGNIVT